MKSHRPWLSAMAAAASMQSVAADYAVTVNAQSTLVQWEGWGTSLCWWANVFGEREDIADLLFTRNDSVSLANGGPANLPALGFNIARYNIGGTGSNSIAGESMKVSSSMPGFKAIELFWLDWTSADPASASWKWDADARQRAMLLAAKRRGADLFEAFSNAPPWWMAKNHATAGADSSGGIDNLQEWNKEQFAVYLATVVKHARDAWGVTFNYVEPFNEPSASWWKFPGTQEGCHFSVNLQKEVVQFLRQQLDQRGLQGVVAIAASDENTPDTTKSTLQAFASSPAVINAVAKINTHGYSGLDPYRGSGRGAVRDLTKQLGKKFWDSEYGESDGSGLNLAESIGLDINEMGVSGFVYWQALDSGGWGLLQSNPGDNWIGGPNAKFYAMAHYSRHVRPGMKIIANSDKKTVVAYDAARKVLVLVTVNKDTKAQTISYSLTGYTRVAGPVRVWTTVTTDQGARYQSSTLALNGKTLSAVFPAVSVLTFEIEGVEL